MKQLLIITGPTATGKTELGIYLAKKFNGEIITADSRQIYRGLDLISGKYPSNFEKVQKLKNHWLIDGVKIWMYDLLSPSLDYSLFQYIQDAKKCLKEITKRKKLPIIVGGSGFYIKGLLTGLTVGVGQTGLRQTLSKLSVTSLQRKLRTINEDKFLALNNSDQNNKRRLIRLIEIYSSPNTQQVPGIAQEFSVLKIGLTGERKLLYKKVDDRILARIKGGMIEEASQLHKSGISFKRMDSLGLELKILAYFLQKKITRSSLSDLLGIKIRNYLKRQLTWFKKDPEIIWFNIEHDDFKTIENQVMKWYDTINEPKH